MRLGNFFGVISSIADWQGAKNHLMTREVVKVLGTIIYGIVGGSLNGPTGAIFRPAWAAFASGW